MSERTIDLCGGCGECDGLVCGEQQPSWKQAQNNITENLWKRRAEKGLLQNRNSGEQAQDTTSLNKIFVYITTPDH